MRAISFNPWLLSLSLSVGCAAADHEVDGLAGESDTQVASATDSDEAAPGSDVGSPLAQTVEAERCDQPTPGARPRSLTLRGNLGSHDPVIIFASGRYWEFQTGKGVYGKVSRDMINWDPLPSQFPSNFSWLSRQVPGVTDLWAPDISYFNGKYHLYYSASTFGSNRSCIGHATKTDLASGSWRDENGVICSNTGSTTRHDWNAIDPNVVLDEQGTPWMSFGSFWSGIKLIKLNAEGKRADQQVLSIASRGGGAIEAPFIIRRCGWYYLFVSFDKCCDGARSTYRVMVGRSRSVTGPYVDKSGRSMMQGGGTQVVAGDSRWKGPGHNAVFFDKGKWYNVYHAYAANDGRAELRITEMAWDAQGWPIPHAP